MASWQRMNPGELTGDYHLTIAGDRVGDLPSLPENVAFDHITHLTLRDMRMAALDAGFLARFSKVRNLDLRGNQLTRLPAGIEQLAELRNLRLGGNRIVLSSDDNLRLSQLVGLRRLELNGNPVGLLPPLTSFPLLRRLSLRNTGLGNLPAELARHGNLELLDMRGNQIQTLPEALSMLPLRLLGGWSCTTIHSRMKPSNACNWPGPQRGHLSVGKRLTYRLTPATQPHGCQGLLRHNAKFDWRVGTCCAKRTGRVICSNLSLICRICVNTTHAPVTFKRACGISSKRASSTPKCVPAFSSKLAGRAVAVTSCC